MGIRKIGCLLAVCLMVFMSRAYAENMQFVDANGSTGYYVDTDSISSDQVVENDVQKTLWTARVAVIRADLNRRYIYLMQFDPDKRMYQIFASEVQRYDTKDVLQSSDQAEPPRPYLVTSPMNEIVQFIMTAKSSSTEWPRMTGNNNEMTRACSHGGRLFLQIAVPAKDSCLRHGTEAKKTKKEDAAASKKQDPI